MRTQAQPASRPRSSTRLAASAATALSLAATALPVLPAALLLAGTSACVTVNVNLPEGEVQKATDDYVRDLYRAKEKGRNNTPGAQPSATPGVSLSNWILPSAYADTRVSFSLDSPKAQALKDKMAANLDDVIAQKKAGTLGETNDGMLAVHTEGKLSKLQEKRLAPVQKLVDSQNSLRKELYDEVIRSNGLSKSNRKDVQKSFARSFQSISPSGTWLQDSDGSWTQKP